MLCEFSLEIGWFGLRVMLRVRTCSFFGVVWHVWHILRYANAVSSHGELLSECGVPRSSSFVTTRRVRVATAVFCRV